MSLNTYFYSGYMLLTFTPGNFDLPTYDSLAMPKLLPCISEPLNGGMCMMLKSVNSDNSTMILLHECQQKKISSWQEEICHLVVQTYPA